MPVCEQRWLRFRLLLLHYRYRGFGSAEIYISDAYKHLLGPPCTSKPRSTSKLVHGELSQSLRVHASELTSEKVAESFEPCHETQPETPNVEALTCQDLRDCYTGCTLFQKAIQRITLRDQAS